MTNFAKELKVGTKKSHTAAENTAFVKSFLRGVVSPDNYKCLVSDLYFVYKALEEEVYGLRTPPIVGSLYFPELERLIALEKDLLYYYGLDWRTKIEPSQACKQYVNRIREVAEDEPELLVGHHYTRYLGDLSGGQILKNIAKKAMNLEKAGLDFYEFENIDDAKTYKEKYRSVLDELPLTVSEKNAIITEANYAFRLNMYMFDELKGNAAKSFFQIVFRAIFDRIPR